MIYGLPEKSKTAIYGLPSRNQTRGVGGLQNFKKWHEQDTPNWITVTSAVQVDFVHQCNADVCLYKDFGSDWFKYGYKIDFEFRIEADSSQAVYSGLVGVANSVGGLTQIWTSGLFVYFYYLNNRMYLKCDGTQSYIAASLSNASTYYATLTRALAAPKLQIFNDPARSSLFGQITFAKTGLNYRYLNIAPSYNNGTANSATGFLRNLVVRR